MSYLMLKIPCVCVSAAVSSRPVVMSPWDRGSKASLSSRLTHFASHRCGPSSIPGLGRGRMCEKFRQLLAVGRWFPPGTPVPSTIKKLISSSSSSSSFHRLDMTLAVAEALNPNTPNLNLTLNGSPLRWTNKAKYLGNFVNSSLNDCEDIRMKTGIFYIAGK